MTMILKIMFVVIPMLKRKSFFITFIISHFFNYFFFFQDVWVVPNRVLFRLHGPVQRGPGHNVRYGRVRGHEYIRQEDILHR